MNPDLPGHDGAGETPTPSDQPPPPDPPAETPTPAPAIVTGQDAADTPPPETPAKPARVDRWAHRRAEPRPLALLWTTYLAVATIVMLTSLVAYGGADHEIYRPAARALLAVTAMGVAVLWPMLRLSQVLPAEGARSSVAKDLVVVLAPVQAVILPQMFFVLADWPLEVVAALSAMLAVWGVLIGAVLVVALQSVAGDETKPTAPRGPSAARAVWMAVIICLVASGPLIGLMAQPVVRSDPEEPGRVSPWALTSPITAVFEIARDRPWSGQAADARPAHWWAIAIIGGMDVLIWTGLAVWPRRRPQPPPAADRPLPVV